MRTENIISDPIKKTYKYAVYSTFAFVGIFLAGFIVWSFSCFSGALYDLMTKTV